mmetsp:Transcript_57531/g.123649  ORF Transcript_57531/g.123649 Transcript_57531/m.123649 type:complete len:85 (+) Transcript_57531:372-626(+)
MLTPRLRRTQRARRLDLLVGAAWYGARRALASRQGWPTAEASQVALTVALAATWLAEPTAGGSQMAPTVALAATSLAAPPYSWS